MRILVTGAAGFIGSHLSNRLIHDGNEVIGLDNERSGDWGRVDLGVRRIYNNLVDLSDTEFDALLDGVEVLFHLAAEKYNSSKATPDSVTEVNIVATQKLFRAAARAGVKRTVFTSSLYAYGSMGPDAMSEADRALPNTYYGMSKLAGEHILASVHRDIGLSWNAARLFFVYGPRQYAEGGYKSVIITNFERMLRGESPLIFGDGQQSLDYIFVDDVVDGLLLLATGKRDSEVVNFASGRSASISELTEIMVRTAGWNGGIEHGPADWTAGSSRFGDPSLAEEVFRWTAVTSLEDGLRHTWEWLIASRAK